MDTPDIKNRRTTSMLTPSASLSFIAITTVTLIYNSTTVVMAASTETTTDTDKTAFPTREQLYQQHCASCHGNDRLGSIGPALLPENLKRLRKKNAVDVISNGRVATQMPAITFSGTSR